MTVDLLVFGAHPDDAEIGMGGTIYKHTQAGRKVVICDLTLAELSSNGTVDTRIQEAKAASAVLSLFDRSNLRLPDRGLFICQEQIELITMEIRKYKPRLVFAPYWQDRHPDHVMCSRLVKEAVFNAKLRKYVPETPSWQAEQLLFYFINDLHESDIIIDVSDIYDKKVEALKAYSTQFDAMGEKNDYVATPLNQNYLGRIEARDRLLGHKRAVEYAEGFVSDLPVIVNLF